MEREMEDLFEYNFLLGPEVPFKQHDQRDIVILSIRQNLMIDWMWQLKEKKVSRIIPQFLV